MTNRTILIVVAVLVALLLLWAILAGTASADTGWNGT